MQTCSMLAVGQRIALVLVAFRYRSAQALMFVDPRVNAHVTITPRFLVFPTFFRGLRRFVGGSRSLVGSAVVLDSRMRPSRHVFLCFQLFFSDCADFLGLVRRS